MLCATGAGAPIEAEDNAATRIQAQFRGRRARLHALKQARGKRGSKNKDNDAETHSTGEPSAAVRPVPAALQQSEEFKGASTATASIETVRGPQPQELSKSSPSEYALMPTMMSKGLPRSDSAFSSVPSFPVRTARTDYLSLRRELESRHTTLPPSIQQIRISAYLLLDEPRSSRAAQVMSVLLLIMIIVSIATFTIETMPELKHVSKDTWTWIEVFCTAVFTVEYIARLSVCTVAGRSAWTFVKTPMNLVDLFAIAPFYLFLAMRHLQMAKALGVLRTVRLVRLFRIFKLGRYSSGLQLMAEALKKSSQALSVLSFFLCIGIVLFSSAVYYVEKMGCPDKEELESQHVAASNQTEWDLYLADCRVSTDGWHQLHGLCCDANGAPLDIIA
jgi:hypothetical protein